MLKFKIIFGVFLLLMATSLFAQESPTTQETLDSLGGYLCPDGVFTCVNITVPVDHFDANNTATTQVVFGVLPAAGERKGTFVTVVGGPGYSGLLSAVPYSAYFDPAILEHFDSVFFDIRGVGLSGGLDCPNAISEYYQSDARATTPEGEQAVVETARTFAESCVAEMGNPDLIPYLSTQQAIEDLEVFLTLMGVDKIWLYGESYGTQFSQEYATAHPDRIAGLILDGVVDLTLTGPEYYVQQAQAFNDVLVAALEFCNQDVSCAADMNGDAVEFYDDLAAELTTAPIAVTFPLSSGETAQRTFSIADLEVVASGATYEKISRAMLIRALAAAQNGDFVPLLRLTYQELSLHPDTLEIVPEEDFSEGMYYGIECNDYSFFEGTPEERASAFISSGNEVEANVPRLYLNYYTDLPCVFWPHTAPTERPAPFTGEGFVTFILNTTTDPATPVQNGYDVFSRLSDAYMFTQEGGPHVIFGRGETCPDVAVNEFIANGTLPSERETSCEGSLIDEYAPLSPATITDYESVLAAFEAVDTEILYLPEYYYWDLESVQSVGCRYGGTFTFEPTDVGEIFTFENCAFIEGFAMTGTGEYVYAETFTFDVAVSGEAEGQLIYTRDEANDNTTSVTGVYDSEPVQ